MNVEQFLKRDRCMKTEFKGCTRKTLEKKKRKITADSLILPCCFLVFILAMVSDHV